MNNSLWFSFWIFLGVLVVASIMAGWALARRKASNRLQVASDQ